MKTRTISLAFGGAVLIALGGLGAIACSSGGSGTPNSSTGGNTGGGDASKDGTGTSGNNGGNTSGNTGGDGSTGDDGGVVGDDGGTGTSDCGSTPTLHPVDAGEGPYCPFSAVGDAGNLTCNFGDHCCEPASGTGTCNTDCTAQPDGGTDWACQGAANCPAGQVCCAVTSGAGQDPGCSYHFLHHFTGSVCATSCGSGQIQMCENLTGECDADSGTTCQAAKGKGGSFGLCL